MLLHCCSLLNIVRTVFRCKRQKEEEEPVSSSSKNNKLQNTENNQITDLHNDGNIDKDNQIKELHTCTTTRSDEDAIKNITTHVHKDRASNSMIMGDNQLYFSSTDTNDDILMVDNEIYSSEITNNDFKNNYSPVMVENEIYMET